MIHQSIIPHFFLVIRKYSICMLWESITLNPVGLTVLPSVKKRERLKSIDLTIIGLPAKQNRRDNLHSRKPVGFSRLHTTEKKRLIHCSIMCGSCISHMVSLACMIMYTCVQLQCSLFYNSPFMICKQRSS